ncbi:glycosyltransferase family 2 protein [Bradyrhizobium sp. SYSU BS000235]|uniref:glycosyltransferase family 2 protein n=1 Tax=Bradyrhizobium sp. SYSU BS000235 TaxID=3411332 RepID=UPI003C7759B2
MNEQSPAKRPIRKVSIVTVTHNARDSLRLTMESVMRQSFPDVDHVVIDGCSTDGTQAIVQEYEVGTFVSEPDDGIYDAMDKGARLAKGDIIIFLNAGDTFFDDDVCGDVVEFLEQTDADIVFGNVMPVYLQHGDKHDHGAFRAGELLNLGYLCNRSQIHDESIHHQATFYRSGVFAETTYKCADPAGTGEYNVLMSALFRHDAHVRYIPRNISRFVLGGISTRDFDAEWRRFVACRDTLRRLYSVKTKPILSRDKYEFHGGIPPDTVPAGVASPSRQRRPSREAIKRWTRKRSLFRLYGRLAIMLTERVAGHLLPQSALPSCDPDTGKATTAGQVLNPKSQPKCMADEDPSFL